MYEKNIHFGANALALTVRLDGWCYIESVIVGQPALGLGIRPFWRGLGTPKLWNFLWNSFNGFINSISRTFLSLALKIVLNLQIRPFQQFYWQFYSVRVVNRGRSGQKIPDNPTRPGVFWSTRNPTFEKLTRPGVTRYPTQKPDLTRKNFQN